MSCHAIMHDWNGEKLYTWLHCYNAVQWKDAMWWKTSFSLVSNFSFFTPLNLKGKKSLFDVYSHLFLMYHCIGRGQCLNKRVFFIFITALLFKTLLLFFVCWWWYCHHKKERSRGVGIIDFIRDRDLLWFPAYKYKCREKYPFSLSSLPACLCVIGKLPPDLMIINDSRTRSWCTSSMLSSFRNPSDNNFFPLYVLIFYAVPSFYLFYLNFISVM